MSYQMNFAKDINSAMEALDLMPLSGESVVVMTDFAAVHFDEKVIEHSKNKGYILFRHSGGLTPLAQMNDTCIHRHLHSEYKRLLAMEKHQRDLRPAELDWLRFARTFTQFKL